jgi:hypothetical protein
VFARYSLFLGVFISILTLVAGWYAFNSVDHDTPSHLAMKDHRFWAFATFAVFAVAAIWLAISKTMRETVSVAFIVFILIGGGLLFTTGYKGAELVYKYGLGVQSLPDVGSHNHASGHDHGEHSHNDGHEHENEHSNSNEKHDHEAEAEMTINANDMADLEMGMDAQPEPEVIVDKDGISKQTLPAEDMPMQATEDTPAGDGHNHQH